MAKAEIQIRCHCGNIRLALQTQLSPSELPLRRCLCGFCSSRGSVYTSDRNAVLTVTTGGHESVTEYRNPESISAHTMFFLVCKSCGGAPVAISEIDGRDYAVVNVTGGSEPSLSQNPIVDMDFDAEDLAGRLQRRKATWIGNVVRRESPRT